MVFDNLLHSKHQKLILQCYPPGKAVDKKPNPSELSYLLYYASTRRVKLEKVFSFLHKRTISDVGRKRAGNLQVTLGIISSLIEKCADNLNVFANEVCLILLLILKIKDVALSKSALTTYGVLCSNLDGGLFYGDKVFIDQFKEVSQQLINITSASSSSDLLDWKLISMLACSHVTNCLAYNSKLAKYFVSLCIPLCVDVVKHGNTEQELKGRLNNNMELTKIILSKSQQVPPAVSTVSAGPPLLADGEITNEDVEETALSALKCYFDTMVTSQITESTKILVRHCFNIDENKWGRVLLEICTTWVPVQLRFAILSTLLQRVTVDFLDRKDFKFQIEGANYILGLLLSEINMIGLSVSDVIQQLLTLQSRVVLEKLELQSSEVDALVGVYSDCICNIATYVYYVDQVPDSIQEILIKIDSTFGKVSNPVTAPVTATTTSSTTIPTSKSPHTATATGNGTINGVGSVGVASSIPIDGLKLSSLIIIYMNNISKILNTLKQKPSTITRNHVKLEHWEISLSLLSPESSFNGFDTTILNTATISEIQIRYFKVFRDYLGHEFYSNEEEESDTDSESDTEIEIHDEDYKSVHDRMSTENKAEARTYLSPNSNNYITNQHNFLSSFFTHLDKLLRHENCENLELTILIVDTLKDLSNLLGINFFSNFVPVFFHWIEDDEVTTTVSKPIQVIRETIGYSIMHYSLKIMDEQYPSALQDSNYCKHSSFFKNIEIDINTRRNAGLWVLQLDNSKLVFNDEVNHDVNQNMSTKKSLQTFINNNSWLSSWLSIDPVDMTRNLEDEQDHFLHQHQHQHQHRHNHDSRIGTNGNTAYDNESEESSMEYHPLHRPVSNSIGLGLGTANDITSIHSGIIHNGGQYLNRNGNSGPAESIHTDNRFLLTPRVADLKDLVYNRDFIKAPAITFGEKYQTTPNSAKSVLSKQMIHKEVDSILDGLNSDCDSEIVV